MTKIIQIACSESRDSENGPNSSVFALTDDGRVFRLHDQEVAYPKGSNRKAGIWSAFGRPLPSLDVTMPVFVPTVAGLTERDVQAHWYAARAKQAEAAAPVH